MLYGVYSIRDVKTGFMSPTIDVNDDSAIRNFHHSISQSEGILFTFSGDFSLYLIGKFDSDHGILDPVIPPVCIAEGSDSVRFLKEASKNG